MHRALTIPELLSEIFRIVRESNEEWKPVVSGLSRVCKGFHEPALDELWKTQSCLIPTLLVLHGDAVKVKDSPLPSEDNVDEDLHTTVPTQALYLARPLTENDIQLLRKYTSRVRELRFSFERSPRGHYAVDNSIVEALAVSVNPLFPNLRNLDWFPWKSYPSYTTFEPFLNLILIPKLDTLSIEYNEELIDAEVLSLLPAVCPNLTNLTLAGDPTPSGLSAINNIFQKSSRLECITIDHTLISWTGWCTVNASLPKLKQLEVDLDPMGTTQSTEWSSMPARSMTIEELILNTNDIQRITDFLTNATFPCLKTLTIFLHNPTGPPLCRKILRFFKAIADACPESLEAILILNKSPFQSSSREIPEHTRPNYIAYPFVFKPLYKFKDLRKLYIRAGWYWDLDNAFVLEACKAWPKLDQLLFDPNHLWPEELRITIDILESIAQLLPNLFVFGATIDATSPPKRSARSPCTMKDIALLMPYSTITSARDVAIFLSRLYPNARGVDGRRPLSFNWDDDETKWISENPSIAHLWTQVNVAMDVIKHTIADERSWYRAEDISDPEERAKVSLERLQT